METQDVINEGGPGVPVPPYGHTLIDTIGATGYDVVQLIGHPTRARNIRNTAPGRGEGRGGERRGEEGREGEGRGGEGRGGDEYTNSTLKWFTLAVVRTCPADTVWR